MEQLKKSSIHAIFVGMWVSCLAEAFYYFLSQFIPKVLLQNLLA